MEGKKISSKRVLIMFLFFVGAVVLNIVFNRSVGAFGLPIFLDNVGTILVAAISGYVPGIMVGYITNIANMSGNPENAYYAVISALISVAAAFMARRGFFESGKKTVLSIPIFAFLGGVIGSLLTYMMYGFGMGEGISAPFAKVLLEDGKLSVFQAQLVSDVVIDLIDKTITVIIFIIIYKLIPKRVKNYLAFTGWRQTPMSEKEKAAAKHNSTRSMSLRVKIILIISLIMIFVAVVTTAISYLLYKNYAIDSYKHTCKNVSALSATCIDPEKVEHWLETGVKDEDYYETEEKLRIVRESSEDIEYLYIYQIREDGCYVVFDLDSEGLEGEELGDFVPFDESFSKYLPALIKGEDIEPMITDDTYGHLLTDYHPVYNSEGKCVCYACADIQMSQVRINSISFITKIGSLFIGFFILILAVCIWLADYNLLYPLNSITLSARKFAYDSEESIDVGVERIKKLKIHTGDEIENLYESMSKTLAETAGYIDDVREKGEEIALIQNGLIFVLADMVESRDKNTGDHIRKTAAYVDLILRKMKESGKYDDILTKEYMEDVVSSAPLHDVGKIKVSDVILNKPGKLTDEEFEIMKTHTTAGEEIINRAMALVSDSDYLKEAKNLATYHHEKWNGSGYPCGLKGEEIPLSARIMAIADVFDALVSRRSYKEPFTYEKAFEIIEEGAGQHFDPEIAKLFLASKEEAIEIAEKHMEDS